MTSEQELSARQMGPQSSWAPGWPNEPSPQHALISHQKVVERAWRGDDAAKAVIDQCYGCAVLNDIVVNTH